MDSYVAWAYGADGTGRLVAFRNPEGAFAYCQRCDPSTGAGTPSEFGGIDKRWFGIHFASGAIWENPNEGCLLGTECVFDAADGGDANTYIDDIHGPNLASTVLPNDRELLHDSSLNNCDPGGTANCTDDTTAHDSTAAAMAVGRVFPNRDIGVAHNAKYLALSLNTIGVQEEALFDYAVEMGVTAISAPRCTTDAVGSGLTCQAACEDFYATHDTDLDGTGPFYANEMAAGTAATGFICSSCVPSQVSVLPLDPRTKAPHDNWCRALPLSSLDDMSIYAYSVTWDSAAASWTSGTLAGVLMVMCERYACSSPPTRVQRLAIMQRLCRTADKIGSTAYAAAWPKGTTEFPGAAWNVNRWNDQYGCGVINLGRAVTEKLSGLDY